MGKYTILHNEKLHRFEILSEGYVAYVEYKLKDKSMDIIHTFVPGPQEGKGIASALTERSLEYALEQGLGVVPTCPYTKAYIAKHPRYQELVHS